MATWTARIAQIDTAIDTITTALAAGGGSEVIEYTIGATTVRKKPSSDLLADLMEARAALQKLQREDAATSTAGRRFARVGVPRGAI